VRITGRSLRATSSQATSRINESSLGFHCAAKVRPLIQTPFSRSWDGKEMRKIKVYHHGGLFLRWEFSETKVKGQNSS